MKLYRIHVKGEFARGFFYSNHLPEFQPLLKRLDFQTGLDWSHEAAHLYPSFIRGSHFCAVTFPQLKKIIQNMDTFLQFIKFCDSGIFKDTFVLSEFEVNKKLIIEKDQCFFFNRYVKSQKELTYSEVFHLLAGE